MSDAIKEWWQALDAGSAARLRRCETARDALLVPEALALIRRLGAQNWPLRTAALACVLAHVKEGSNQPVMRVCGRQRFGDETAVVSEQRFRRFIQTTDTDDLMRRLSRIVRQLGGVANVTDLSEIIRFWSDRQRERLAAEYYAAYTPEIQSKETAS